MRAEDIVAMGLTFCNQCCLVGLVGQRHPRPCCGMESAPETSATREAITRALVGGELLRSDYSSLAFVDLSTFDTIFTRQIRVFDYFPASPSLLTAWSEIFLAVTRQLLDAESSRRSQLWKLFFMIPYLLFQRAPVAMKKSTSALLHQRMQWFLSSNWDRLLEHAQQCSSPGFDSARTTTTTTTADSKRMKSVISKASHGDISKASQLLFSDASFLDPMVEPTRAKVSALFSDTRMSHQQPADEHNTAGSPETIKMESVATALQRSARASAGPSGWHVSCIKALCKLPVNLKRVTEVLNRLLHETLPDDLLSSLQLGSLTTLSKSGGGVRPIVIRDAWLRLLSKSVLQEEQGRMSEHLPPIQAGVGLQGGSELIIHTVRQHLESNQDDCLLAVDCCNAYGTVFRDAIQKAITSAAAPAGCSLTPRYFSRFVNSTQTVFSSSGFKCRMAEGLIQGDPLSPLLFALALQPVLVSVQESMTQTSARARIFAYLDDVFIIGPPAAVQAAFQLFSTMAPSIGLKINPSKSKVLSPIDTVRGSPELQQLCSNHNFPAPEACIEILGSPVGSLEEEARLTEDKIEEAKFIRLVALPDKQTRLAILRYCITALHTHLIRTVPPQASSIAAKKHDQLVSNVVASLLDLDVSQMPAASKAECALPIKVGGLGLPSLERTAKQAYLSSVWLAINTWSKISPNPCPMARMLASSKQLAESLESTVQLLSDFIRFSKKARSVNGSLVVNMPQVTDELPTRPLPSSFSRKLSHAQANMDSARLFKTLRSDRERAQFLSKQGFASGAWLAALPSDPSLRFYNADFTVALRLWLRVPNLPLFGLTGSEACQCRRVDIPMLASKTCTEDHLLNCNGSGQFNKRHDAIVNTFHAMAQSVQLRAIVEPPVSAQQQSQKRFDISIDRADASASNLKLDVAVWNPQAQSAVAKAAKYPMHTAHEAVQKKNNKYKDNLTSGDKFVALAFETFGAMHQNVRDVVALLSKRVSNMPPPDTAFSSPSFTAYWLQRLSVTLWRENARAVCETAQESKRQVAFEHDIDQAEETAQSWLTDSTFSEWITSDTHNVEM